MAASYLAHSLKYLDAEEKIKYLGHVTAIPGLVLNHNQVNRDKNLLNLHGKSPLREKNNCLFGHDVINNSLKSKRTNNFSPSSIGGLIKNLEDRKDHIRAAIYCQRKGTQNVLEELIKTGILTISVENFLDSIFKQKCQPKIIEGYSELHKQHELELKSLRLVWEHKERLPELISKERSRKKNIRRPGAGRR